jgi:catechol 2,3-dioxygenase-like lactoylglutathione lyase family enzyme
MIASISWSRPPRITGSGISEISCAAASSTPRSLAFRAQNPSGSRSRSIEGTTVSQIAVSVARWASFRTEASSPPTPGTLPSSKPPTEGEAMLGDHPIYPVLLAKDLEESKEFYAGKLGLEIIMESAEGISYRCGDTQLEVTASTTGTADEQTQAGWRVDDLEAELEDLRGRGVKIEEYDTPGLKTENGIADLGFARAAWIVDPHGNALGILQLK